MQIIIIMISHFFFSLLIIGLEIVKSCINQKDIEGARGDDDFKFLD